MIPIDLPMREIAERLNTELAYPSPSPRWYEDVQQIADYVLARTAPLLVTCRECGGSGQFDEIKDDIKCDACHGTGYEGSDAAMLAARAPEGTTPTEMRCVICKDPAMYYADESAWRHEHGGLEGGQFLCEKYGYPIEGEPA